MNKIDENMITTNNSKAWIAWKFLDVLHNSRNAEALVTFQSDTVILKPNLGASRFHQFYWYAVLQRRK